MKKLYPLIFLLLVVYTYHATFTDDQDCVADQATTVDVRALDDLIIDFPEPDLEQLKVPVWKTWLIRAADTMLWTVQTGKDAVVTAYARCKKLIMTADEPDEIDS
jgi:hypothetical protein